MNELKRNIYYSQSYDSEKVKVKTCTCGSEKISCPSHTFSNRSIGDGYFIEGTNSQINYTFSSNETIITPSENTPDFDECTVRTQTKNDRLLQDELELSLTSLVTENYEGKTKDKKIPYEKWLAEKNQQKREQELERIEIQERILMEHEKKLFMEQVNFKRWLKNKIVQQKKMDEEKRKKIEEKKLLLEEQEKKEELNKKIFQLWLKKKENEELTQKLKEHTRKLQETEENKKRMQRNAEAYEDWLKNSVHRPRPVPLNRGIESLRSSVSVSYINPVPWTPNIEHPIKNMMSTFKCDRQIY